MYEYVLELFLHYANNLVLKMSTEFRHYLLLSDKQIFETYSYKSNYTTNLKGLNISASFNKI